MLHSGCQGTAAVPRRWPAARPDSPTHDGRNAVGGGALVSFAGQAVTGSSPSSDSRVRMRSRIGLTDSMPCLAGSASAQSSYCLLGKIGRASPHPMVMTTSDVLNAGQATRVPRWSRATVLIAVVGFGWDLVHPATSTH